MWCCISKYTARESGGLLKEQAKNELQAAMDAIARIENEKGLVQLFSLRHDFSDALHKLLNPMPEKPQTTEFEVKQKHFPRFLANKKLKFRDNVMVYLKPKGKESVFLPDSKLALEIEIKEINQKVTIDEWVAKYGEKPEAKIGLQEGIAKTKLSGKPTGKWSINAKGLDKKTLDDILILVNYEIEK